MPTTADAVYSKVDFSDDGISQRRMKVKSRSFFDIVRKEIVKDNLIFVGELRGAVGNRSFEISSLKYYWLILDKLVQDPVVEGSDAFIEFAQLVVDLSSSSSISSSSSSDLEKDLYALKLQTIHHVIEMKRPLMIFKVLLKHLQPQITETDSKSIFTLIYTVVDEYAFNKVLPRDFSIYATALEILDPIPWFVYIYGEGYNEDLSSWLVLSPFYLLLQPSKIDSTVLAGIRTVLLTLVFDYDCDKIEVLSEFIRITNFSSCPESEAGPAFQGKLDTFRFILGRFEIEGSDDNLMVPIENDCVGLVEAFLRFDPNILQRTESRNKAIRLALLKSNAEMVIIISTYRSIYSEELESIWRSTPGHFRVNMKRSIYNAIKYLLQISEEFDGDMADCPSEVVNGDRIEYPFPQPTRFERHIKSIYSVAELNGYYLARIILFKYFGVAFAFTRVDSDTEAVPIWREIAGTVNVFLDFMQLNRVVIFKEPRVNT